MSTRTKHTPLETQNDLPRAIRAAVVAGSADVCTEVSRGADELLWKVEAHAWEA